MQKYVTYFLLLKSSIKSFNAESEITIDKGRKEVGSPAALSEITGNSCIIPIIRK